MTLFDGLECDGSLNDVTVSSYFTALKGASINDVTAVGDRGIKDFVKIGLEPYY